MQNFRGQTGFIMGNLRSGPNLEASIHSLLRGPAYRFPPAGQNFIYQAKQK